MITYVTASISRSPAAILEVRVAEAFVAVAEELHFGAPRPGRTCPNRRSAGTSFAWRRAA